MEYAELIKQRYSVRSFKSDPIDETLIHRIIEAGNLAPTAMNNQPYRIYVLKSEESLQKVDQLTSCRYNAPVVLMFVYDEYEQWKNHLESGVVSGVEDVAIVATHVMLAAKDLGIDTCWVNYFSNKAVEEAFDLPSNEHVVLLLDLGYREDAAAPSPRHDAKRPYEELVKEL